MSTDAHAAAETPPAAKRAKKQKKAKIVAVRTLTAEPPCLRLKTVALLLAGALGVVPAGLDRAHSSGVHLANPSRVAQIVVVVARGLSRALWQSALAQNDQAIEALAHNDEAKESQQGGRTIEVHSANGEQTPSVILPRPSAQWATKVPGNKRHCEDALTRLLQIPPLTEDDDDEENDDDEEQKETKPELPWDALLLNEDARRMHGYPMDDAEEGSANLAESYLQLPPAGETDNDWLRVAAIDCEMVGTKDGVDAVARVAVVNDKGVTVYDELVKPAAAVADYRTQWTGLRPGSLDDVNTTLADVHSALSRLLRRESILVGHSLEKDLHVLQLLHERVVDSAVLYDLSGEGVYKAKLRHLAARFLDRSIQTDQSGAVTPGGGHDPAEDALAALDLALLKRVEGLKFGSVPLYPASRNLIARAAQRQPSVATAVLASSTVCAPLHPFARCIVVNDDDAAVRRLAPSAADAGAAKGAKLIVMESREVEMRLAAQSWSQLPPSGLGDAESARTIVRRAVASVCNMVAAALNVVEVNSVVLLVAAGDGRELTRLKHAQRRGEVVDRNHLKAAATVARNGHTWVWTKV